MGAISFRKLQSSRPDLSVLAFNLIDIMEDLDILKASLNDK